MDKVILVSTNALEIAGSLCGIPYVGAAATILQQIVASCNQVVVHKRKLAQLADKCAQLLTVLRHREQSQGLQGTELLEATGRVVSVLDSINGRVKVWSRYGRVKCFVKNAEIEDGLQQCDSEVNTALCSFQVNAHIITHQFQRNTAESSRKDTAEMRDLILQILTDTQELRRVAEMHHAGQHVAESLMAAGQLEMRSLRASLQTDSPYSDKDSVHFASRESQYGQYQRGLIALHRRTGIPPTIKNLNGEVVKLDEFAIAGGKFSDVWLGEWMGGEKVALKALRNIKVSDPKAQKRFEHEIAIWSTLENDHILPFYGVVTNLGSLIHIVSPWQENGNVLEHVKRHPESNQIDLLFGAAKGIEYLHSCNVVHGNVKCANILVSATGIARVCDFGVSKVVEDVSEMSASATALTGSGSARWLAPEIIEGSISSPTKPADTYSFAMAALELFTGKHPYAHRKRDAAVIHDIVVLKRTPPKPEMIAHLTDDLWKLMQECWLAADIRPSMRTVTSRMEVIQRR